MRGPGVKICGLCSEEDAAAAAAAGARMLGFVFVPGTPRFLDPHRADWVRELDGAETVGVFRDSPLAEILELRERLGLDWVQLHGDEPDELLAALGRKVIRRVPTKGGVDWRRVQALAARCLPLLDPGAGSGEACDWSALARRPAGLDLALAGGLTPDNVAAAVRLVRPFLVDVSSGVEKMLRHKDHAAMRAFVAAVGAA